MKTQHPDKMKQKSLMSFFGKASTNVTKAKPGLSSPEGSPKASRSSRTLTDRSSDPPVYETNIPLSKGGSQSSTLGSTNYTRGSNEASSSRDTPATSDPIDVDMLSAEEEEPIGKNTKTKTLVTRKRKIVLEDSEDDLQDVDTAAYRKGLSAYQPSPEANEAKSRAKKRPRVSAMLSDDNEDDGDGPVVSFTQRLTKFKPTAKSKQNRKSSMVDDDDFIVPDDEDEDEELPSAFHQPSPMSDVSSRPSSRLSDYAYTDASEAELDEPSTERIRSSKVRPSLSEKNSSKRTSSNLFLTAAEQRAQRQKEEKKGSEDPFEFLVDIKDKDGIRPGQPGYDPRTLFVPPRAWESFTPFETQFWKIKQNHFDTVLFFQKGKFLELYEDDARIGHQEFDLKLTQRVKMSMVGVPEQSFNFWAAKFLAKGYKVGRVDQAETALGAEMRVAADKGKGKGRSTNTENKDKIVRRELNKVYTNGTLVDEALLTDDQAGHCISIREDGEEDVKTGTQKFGLCVLDSSTSEFNMSAFEDDVCRTKLETTMRQLCPKEVIFTKGNLSVSTTRLLKTVLPEKCLWTSLRESEGLSYEKTMKELKTLYPDGGEDEETDDDMHGLSSAVPEAIRSMLMYHGAVEALGSMIWYLRTLNIDKDLLSMKNFNIYDPMKKGEGLVLDGQTLAHIEANGSFVSGSACPYGKSQTSMPGDLDAVQDLIDHPTFESEFTEVAKGLPDLERIVSRIHSKNCRVKDFLKVLEEIYLVQTKPTDDVPKSWVKSGATKAAARWMVPELAQSIRSLKEAREHKNIAIKEFKNRLYAEFDTDRTVWLRAIRVLSELDCLFSLAKASNALGEPACRPEFVEGDSAWFEFQELRHPALSVSAGFRGDFIPNDVKLGKDVGRIALLTGPNMGGKSTDGMAIAGLVFLYKLVKGVASSSFGTHVANLAGVPMQVVERAETISRDFAHQFKEKIEGKKKDKAVCTIPLVAQADFAFLYSLATGKRELPEDKMRRREVLRGIRAAVRSCLKQSHPSLV
ncbi:hypothetical protein PHLCEN_2v1170 [Hermanssonia centrifuga]|uniref:DNA mismatch repair protein MutS core domain-containing protein n=1 Tax=Hermanssonia centrifuga TaxID=98765 RepID=A0A2R6S3T7_9APHY|nr:hypothetical protein PHLCEN_2v1170 [Hermanssonia centrifuga]